MGLVSELRRRNVFRVAIAYLAAAWLLTEVAGTLFPAFAIPGWAFRFVVIILAIGFLPTLFFSWAYEITPQGLKREKEVVREESIAQITARRLDGITIGLIVLALAFIVADRLWLSPRLVGNTGAPAEIAAESAGVKSDAQVQPDASIAVLPFVNMSDDPSNEYFSDGISEELLNLLSKIPELRVAARTSSFSFKGQNVEIPDIARRLEVAHVLEGSVRKSGDRVRITAQLIKADDGYHMWSESYDRQLGDIFAIQDDIAGAVVDALKLTLLGEAPQTEPINAESYVLFLQAVHVGRHMHEEALDQSNSLLKNVLAIAPGYAKAWRLLARNYAVQVQKRLLPRDEGNALARDAISQALAIDPDLAEAHSWLAVWEAGNGGDLMESAQRLQHALELEPNNHFVTSHAAGFLSILGRLDESIAVLEYALSVDPLGPIIHNNLAWHYLWAGRPDEAVAKVGTLQMLSPDYDYAYSALCWAFLLKGDYNGALQAIQQESDEESRLYGLVQVYHAMDQPAEADSALNEYTDKYGQDRPYSVAALLAFRGQIDRSFAWLEKASSRTGPPSWIGARMYFSNLYNDPRWIPFLESVSRSPEQLGAIDLKVTLPE